MSKGNDDAIAAEENWARLKRPKREKAWKYVGRFMWSFATIEVAVDVIFEDMFNLNAFTFGLLREKIDFGERVKFIKLGFDYLIDVANGEEMGDDQKRLVQKYTDYKGQLERAKKFSEIRNAIAHSAFEHEGAHAGKEEGIRYEAGVKFDNPRKANMPDPFQRKTRTLKKGKKKPKKQNPRLATEEDLLDRSMITYAEFDKYHDEMLDLMFYLHRIETDTANQGLVQFFRNEDFVKDVAKIIASSDNVFLFGRPSPDK